MAKEAPRYKVETLVDMARIPEEALPRFLAELPEMLGFIRAMVKVTDAAGGEEFFKLSVPGVWIDDDKRTFETSVTVGEEKVFEAKGKMPPFGEGQ